MQHMSRGGECTQTESNCPAVGGTESAVRTRSEVQTGSGQHAEARFQSIGDVVRSDALVNE